MKRVLITTVALAALAVPAAAADLAVKYPVKAVAAPVFTWTGFYVGANGGYGGNSFGYDLTSPGGCEKRSHDYGYGEGDTSFRGSDYNNGNQCKTYQQPAILETDRSFGGGNHHYNIVDPFVLNADPTVAGFFAGGQIGYNYQFTNNVVLGFETDLQWSDISGDSDVAIAGLPLLTAHSSIDYFGTIRARLGYAFDRFLPYITGGAAYGKLSSDLYVAGLPILSGSSTNWGWTIGGGAEIAITDHWTFKTEYLYIDLGSNSLIGTYNGFLPVTVDADAKFHTLKAGVNYKF